MNEKYTSIVHSFSPYHVDDIISTERGVYSLFLR